MRRPLQVAIDLDSTVYDLDGPWRQWIKDTYGEEIDEIKSWDFHNQFKCGEKIYGYFAQDDAFLRLKPFPWAVEAIREVAKMGVRQFFLSTTTTKTGAWQKLQAIKRDLPEFEKELLITSGAKDVVSAGLLVDDGPHNLDAFREIGLTCKIPTSYNKETKADYTMADWRDYPYIIYSILEARREVA